MTPLVLTYVICAVAEPARCETHHLVSLAPDELRCIQTALAEIVPHVGPGWTLSRYGCARGGR